MYRKQLLRIAVDRGQLDPGSARDLLTRSDPAAPFGPQLRQAGGLDEAQVRACYLELRRLLGRKNPRYRDEALDRLLVRRALDDWLVEPAAATRYRNEWKRLRTEGRPMLFGELLVARGALVPSQLDQLRAEHMQRHRLCPICGASQELTRGPEAECATCGAPAALFSPDARMEFDDVDPFIGRVLGGCRLLRCLGKGGMGAVYLAHQASLDRDVAVKLLHQSMGAQSEWRERFMREARTAARIEHANLVRVLDVGCEELLYFMVMEFVEGRSLQQVITRQQRLPVAEALRIARDAADGLAAVHDAGIVHRDIKPANLMLTAEGQVKVADFGLARDTASASVSLTGEVIGTPGYMSPEQTAGDPVDHRTDVFSLGITLHAMLVGDSPYRRSSPVATMMATLQDVALPARRFNPEVAPQLQEVIDQMTAKNPARRFTSMAAAREALDRELARLTTRGPRVTAEAAQTGVRLLRSGSASARPRPGAARWALPAIAGVLLLTVGLLLASRQGHQPESPPPPAERLSTRPDPPARQRPVPTPAPEERPRPEQPDPGAAFRDALLANQTAIGQALLRGRIAVAQQLLAQLSGLNPPADQRRQLDEAIAQLRRQLDARAGKLFTERIESQVHPAMGRQDFAAARKALAGLETWGLDRLERRKRTERKTIDDAEKMRQSEALARALAAKAADRERKLRETWDRTRKAAIAELRARKLDRAARTYEPLVTDPRYGKLGIPLELVDLELRSLVELERAWPGGLADRLKRQSESLTSDLLGKPQQYVVGAVDLERRTLTVSRTRFRGKLPFERVGVEARVRWAESVLRARHGAAVADLYLGVALALSGRTAAARPRLREAAKAGDRRASLYLARLRPARRAGRQSTRRTASFSEMIAGKLLWRRGSQFRMEYDFKALPAGRADFSYRPETAAAWWGQQARLVQGQGLRIQGGLLRWNLPCSELVSMELELTLSGTERDEGALWLGGLGWVFYRNKSLLSGRGGSGMWADPAYARGSTRIDWNGQHSLRVISDQRRLRWYVDTRLIHETPLKVRLHDASGPRGWQTIDVARYGLSLEAAVPVRLTIARLTIQALADRRQVGKGIDRYRGDHELAGRADMARRKNLWQPAQGLAGGWVKRGNWQIRGPALVAMTEGAVLRPLQGFRSGHLRIDYHADWQGEGRVPRHLLILRAGQENALTYQLPIGRGTHQLRAWLDGDRAVVTVDGVGLLPVRSAAEAEGAKRCDVELVSSGRPLQILRIERAPLR